MGEGERGSGLEYTCGVDATHVHVHTLLQAIVVLFEIEGIFFFQFPPHFNGKVRLAETLMKGSVGVREMEMGYYVIGCEI